MTPTEAYQAALEAAAALAAGMNAPIQDAANIAVGLPAFSQTVAALIRALPVPEGLDDADELDRLRAENERLRAGLDGHDMTVARAAYRLGQHDNNNGVRASDPRVIMSRVRAALKGGE